MDINPLIVDLKKYEDELLDSIHIASGFGELDLADRYVAHDIAEIKGEKHSDTPFHQVAELYNLPVDEVIQNIRDFINNGFKKMLLGDPPSIKDIQFKDNVAGKE
jgi:hypothetical protein